MDILTNNELFDDTHRPYNKLSDAYFHWKERF